MQHEAVDMVGPEMLQRTGQRLCDLKGNTRREIVGQTVVLAARVREFRLQEKIGARYHTCAIGGGQSLTDSGFEVMPPLVGGVDPAKACAERQFGKGCGAVFLPGCTVEEGGRD